MLSHMKFQIVINSCHLKFFQCAQIKPNSSSLTNVENLKGNFRQFFQICYRKEEGEQEIGDDLIVSFLNLEIFWEKIKMKRENLS